MDVEPPQSLPRGCLHESTHTGTSLIPGWLFWFVSRLHDDWVISYLVIWRSRHVDKRHVWLKNYRKLYACATHSNPLADRFHTTTCGRFAFTWYCWEISYRSEILGPSTTTVVKSCRDDSRQHDILWWYHVNKYRAMRGNRSELALVQKSPPCHVNTPLHPKVSK